MKNKKPLIGVSGSYVLDNSGRFENYWKACVNDDYIVSIVKAGAIPYIIPIVQDESIIRAQVENLDGFIFSGGADINPLEYKEEGLEKLGEIDTRRDWFDMRLFRIVKELKIPTLCICRGHQVAAVANGGSLYQDLSYFSENALVHDQYSTPDFAAHEIKIQKDSLLYEVLQKESIKVNSFHHQVVKDVPKGFKVTAVSSDGAIEAMEYEKSDYFFLSLQWHPEMMAAKENEDMLKLFKKLIQK